jgi:hypothetical protein
MKEWLMVRSLQSDEQTFEFAHHSTSSVIQLKMINKNGSLEEFWMDYKEFDELCNLINKLSENKKQVI